MSSIREMYTDIAREMVANSQQPEHVTEEHVFQEGNRKNRELVNRIIDDLIDPRSRIENFENLDKLRQVSDEGKACLLLMEHYSNFDIPGLYYLLQKEGGLGSEVAERIIAIAGLKLNISNRFVLAFAESYPRIVIYPSRAIESIADPAEQQKETKRARELNRAALREMIRHKYNGRIVLVFPAGTRYRPGKPETKRPVKEIDSYLKSFDHMVMIGIAGNLLHVSPEEDMTADMPNRDLLLYYASEVMDCKSFRDGARGAAPEGVDPKQFAADAVGGKLDELHARAEEARERLLDSPPQ